MTASLLTAANWPIVKHLCKLMGWIMNYIYNFLDKGLSTDSGLVGISIIIYTIIVYTCMLPMTINQQKTSRLTAVINPEVQAIQKKYRNKKDQASVMKQNEEIQQVYDKYGASMMGGCLPMLIQLPFLFALYPVIYDIQHYVPAIATAPAEVNKFLTIPSLTVTPMEMIKNSGSFDMPAIVIIITAVALPVISALTQVISMKLTQAVTQNNNNNKNSQNEQMENTMKTMNRTMPLLSLFMVSTLPTGIGIYWIFSAVVRCVQQLAINNYLKKMSIEDLIEKNKEKAKKKQEKRKERNDKVNYNMAQANTKNIKNSANRSVSSSNNNTVNKNVSKSGSLASKANMVNKFNENKK